MGKFEREARKMMKVKRGSKMAHVINSATFLVLFIALSYGAASFKQTAACTAIFKSCTKSSSIGKFISVTIGLHNFKDALQIFLRVILASFLRDGLMNAWMPSLQEHYVKKGLGEQIKKTAFDSSWIDDNFEGASTERKQSLIARILGLGLFIIRKLLKFSKFLILSVFGTFQALTCLFVHTVCGTVYFGVRSAVTSVFSVVLLVCNCIQIVLRTIHFVYKTIFESSLLLVSRVTHDCSLLAFEVVEHSQVKRNENLLNVSAGINGLISESGDAISVAEKVSRYNLTSDSDQTSVGDEMVVSQKIRKVGSRKRLISK